MKNIHVIKTDKPSRLVSVTQKIGKDTWKSIYYIRNKNNIYDGNPCITPQYQNIYITNKEEIKIGDWFICLEHSIEDFKFNSEIAQRLISKQNKELFEGWINGITISDVTGDRLQGNYQIEYCKKIILTTDQDLIQNGVQAIDDEFLEWFVKNPSCEVVEVVKEDWMLNPDVDFFYKIIIPKEELHSMNYEVECNMCGNIMSLTEDESIYACYNSECTRCYEEYEEEPKQETLEEFAENYIQKQFYTDNQDKIRTECIISGAKWQMERMYSEEDLIAFGKSCFYKGFEKSEKDDANCYTAFREEIGSIIEQFNKK